ncbi:Ig-like domain-containing protein [Deinococcus yavapaiensis]|nr:Ig-like domain-containing protein [Deinococcus yavapaiensis]
MANTTLPLRVAWVATPSIETYDIRTVQFFIDGKLVSTPQNAPYRFNGPGNFLVTTFLTPGRHTFTATVTALDGRKASETVTANVAAAPQPPAALAGAWERVITKEQFDAAGLDTGNDPVLSTLLGRPWRIIIDSAGLWTIDPMPSGGLLHVNIRGNTLTTLGPIRTGPNDAVFAYGAPLGGDNYCGPVNRDEGAYSWAVTGNQLTLRAVKPACASEEVILTGTWTRVTPTPKR